MFKLKKEVLMNNYKNWTELEFKALDKSKEEKAPKKDSKYETILSEKDLNKWINKINKSKY